MLSFEKEAGRIGHTSYQHIIGKVSSKGRKIKDYNVKIDGWNNFEYSVKNDLKTLKHPKNCYGPWRWLYNCLLDRLAILR